MARRLGDRLPAVDVSPVTRRPPVSNHRVLGGRQGPAGRLHPVGDRLHVHPRTVHAVDPEHQVTPSKDSATSNRPDPTRAASTQQKYSAASTRGENRWFAAPSTVRLASSPLRESSDRRAGSRPDRVSWVGKTPRVRSRSASSAEFVLSTRRLMPFSADPAATAWRATRSSSGSATR